MNTLTDKELEDMNTTKPIKYKEHVFPQHLFKPTVGQSDRRKYGKLEIFKCIQCGCIKQYDRNSLKSIYMLKGMMTFAPPERCVYDSAQYHDMKKFKLNPPTLERSPTIEELVDSKEYE